MITDSINAPASMQSDLIRSRRKVESIMKRMESLYISCYTLYYIYIIPPIIMQVGGAVCQAWIAPRKYKMQYVERDDEIMFTGSFGGGEILSAAKLIPDNWPANIFYSSI